MKTTAHILFLSAKTWVKADGVTLVPDGHEEAAILVGPAGYRFRADDVSRYVNAEEFFTEDAPTPVTGPSGPAHALAHVQKGGRTFVVGKEGDKAPEKPAVNTGGSTGNGEQVSVLKRKKMKDVEDAEKVVGKAKAAAEKAKTDKQKEKAAATLQAAEQALAGAQEALAAHAD